MEGLGIGLSQTLHLRLEQKEIFSGFARMQNLSIILPDLELFQKGEIRP